MTKIRFIKALGLFSAIAIGAASILAGDVVTGVGVIAAAFSSASAVTTDSIGEKSK